MTDTTKTEALRLADAIDPFTRPQAPDHLTVKVAADELRRLSAVEAERDRLRAALAASCDEERDQIWEAGPGGGCMRALEAEQERDRLAARLDRAIRAAEEHFGDDAIRHKLSLFKNGRARNVFPQQMNGQWFAFQRADNDAHVGLSLRCAEAESERDRLAAECEALRAESFDAVLDNLCATLPDDGSSITIHLEHWAGSVTATDWDGDVCDEEPDEGSMLSRVKSAARWLDEQQAKLAARDAAMGGKE